MPPSSESDTAWDGLMPRESSLSGLSGQFEYNLLCLTPLSAGGGFISVNDPVKYDLQPGIPTDGPDIYSVSMFHQLHCLVSKRSTKLSLLTDIDTAQDSREVFLGCRRQKTTYKRGRSTGFRTAGSVNCTPHRPLLRLFTTGDYMCRRYDDRVGS